MSCPPELHLAIYVDGELPRAEARELESHLIHCRACRGRIVALGDETSLLADALRERERPGVARGPALVPEPGLALGLPTAVAAVTAAFAVGGVLVEGLPGGLDLVNPLRLKGAYEMFFDIVFLLREQVPGLIELALVVGAVGAVSAVGVLTLNAVARRVAGPTSLALLLLSLLLASAEPARAFELRFEEEVHVSAEEVIDRTLVVTAEVVLVDGLIDGDLIVAAERVSIRGQVEGSVYAFTRDLEIVGTVARDVHSVAERVRVDGRIGGDAYSVSESFTVASGGAVARDAALFGEGMVIDGEVGRDVAFLGRWLEVGAVVGRHVDARAKRLSLRSGARVGGDLRAMLEDGQEIDAAPGAVVEGYTEVVPRQDGVGRHYWAHYTRPAFYAFLLLELVAAFLLGLLLYPVFPWLAEAEPLDGRRFFRLLGTGFLVVVATPVAILLALLTLVGIPIGVLGLFVYLTLLYGADIVVGALIGHALLAPEEPGFWSFARALLLGLAIVKLGSAVPILGVAIGIVALLFGTGLLYQRLRARVLV